MSIEGDKFNPCAPEECNVYRNTEYTRIKAPAGRYVYSKHGRTNPKPQRGGMFIEHRQTNQPTCYQMSTRPSYVRCDKMIPTPIGWASCPTHSPSGAACL